MSVKCNARIPVNIIWGFLGAGKTTLIRHLLSLNSQKENWVVLVNEFGQVGIDGAVLESSGVQVKEIAGGCMCCVGNVVTRVALNQIIKELKPERLIIEPSGLAHPDELLSMLAEDQYQEVLWLESSTAVVDARNISDSRYTQHEIFNAQIALCDRLFASKSNHYSEQDLELLTTYATVKNPGLIKNQFLTTFNDLDIHWLTKQIKNNSHPLQEQSDHSHSHHHDHHDHHHHDEEEEVDTSVQAEEIKSFEGATGGDHSCGFVFGAAYSFSLAKVESELMGFDGFRAKSLLKTDQGTVLFDSVKGVLTKQFMDQPLEQSRFEFIDGQPLSEVQLRATLTNCLIEHP